MNERLVPLKYLATLNDESLGEDTDADYEIQYIDIGNVDSSGQIHEVASYRFADAPSRARRRVRDGDVIVSCVRTYLQAIAPIEKPADNLIVSTGFAVVRPKPGVLRAGFCKYALREQHFLAEVERRSVGVSYPAINASDLGAIPLPALVDTDQHLVEVFLDRETQGIDALIAAKQRLLDLLAEKRMAIIASAVTRGINLKAKLRDSGVPWLGEIPEHWTVERARWLFRERDVRSEAGEEELLTVSHITGVTPRSEKDVNMFEAETNEGYKLCESGDLVINTLWAWMGAMGVAPVKGIVSPAYNVYEPGKRLMPEYIDALVRLPVFAQEVTRYSKGVWSSRLRLYPEGFFETYLPVPPMDEQRTIAEHITRETTKLDNLRAATERTIALLQERRAALIAAAVTGQIEVGGGV
ncbi:MAG TPA: restriction endonuclease subunit S [Bryobacteraceae bacterium]|nr:restriction endonuclease subunit S [Bryobacteraceae bacterium]